MWRVSNTLFFYIDFTRLISFRFNFSSARIVYIKNNFNLSSPIPWSLYMYMYKAFYLSKTHYVYMTLFILYKFNLLSKQGLLWKSVNACLFRTFAFTESLTSQLSRSSLLEQLQGLKDSPNNRSVTSHIQRLFCWYSCKITPVLFLWFVSLFPSPEECFLSLRIEGRKVSSAKTSLNNMDEWNTYWSQLLYVTDRRNLTVYGHTLLTYESYIICRTKIPISKRGFQKYLDHFFIY